MYSAEIWKSQLRKVEAAVSVSFAKVGLCLGEAIIKVRGERLKKGFQIDFEENLNDYTAFLLIRWAIIYSGRKLTKSEILLGDDWSFRERVNQFFRRWLIQLHFPMLYLFKDLKKCYK